MNAGEKKSRFKLLDGSMRVIISASVDRYRQRFQELLSACDIHKIRQRASRIRDRSLENACELWNKARVNLEENGIRVHMAQDNVKALETLRRLLRGRKKIVKSKSNLLGEIDISNALDEEIVETDTGDWIVQQMGVVRVHPNAPAMGMSTKEIASFLSNNNRLAIKASAESVVEEICKTIRDQILAAEVGLTGANFVTSEGHIVIVENEGNISLITRLPHTHIAVVAYHRIVESLEDAVYLSKCLSKFGTGKSSTAYVNIISSPSYTTDIEKKVVRGAQGAKEVHLIVVDNNRSQLLANDKLRKALRCIGCGACMLYCPVSEIAGSNYGGKYQGGMGLVLSHFVCKQRVGINNGVFACLGCEMCEEVCPVQAKIWDNIKQIRRCVESRTKQRIISELISKGSFSYREEE